MQTISNRQFCSPSAAAAASVAATGVAWTNTAWVEIAPTTDVVWVLTGIVAWTSIVANVTIDFEIDIGIGAAGSEVVFTTVRGRHRAQSAALYCQPIHLPIPIDGLNGRHAFRIRTSGTRTDTWHVALTYLKNPLGGNIITTRSPGLVLPSAAAPISLVAGSTWLNGSWVQLQASATADYVVTHIIAHCSSSAEFEVDLGVGAAASEQVITTIRSWNPSLQQSGISIYDLINPLDKITSGSRIAMRCRADSGAPTVSAGMIYHAKPL